MRGSSPSPSPSPRSRWPRRPFARGAADSETPRHTARWRPSGRTRLDPGNPTSTIPRVARPAWLVLVLAVGPAAASAQEEPAPPPPEEEPAPPPPLSPMRYGDDYSY